MILGFFRILFGFVLACLAAAAVQVGFVVTPAELMAGSDREWLAAGQLTLFVATQSAVFASPFALLAAIVAEWQAIRGWFYYLLSGLAIATAGFAALYSAESAGQPTIANRYALIAYFTAGAIGGLVYWLFAGRGAGGAEAYDDNDITMRRLSDVQPSGSVIPPKPVAAPPPVGTSPGSVSAPPRPASVPASKPPSSTN